MNSMDMTKILDFVDSAIKSHYTYDPKELKRFSHRELEEIMSLLLLRVESKEQELKTMVDSLEQLIYDRTKELMEKNRNLEILATHDALTKVYNRRFFAQKLKEYSALAERFGHTFSCIMADIDHFKNFNDIYGHQAGDYVLYSIAQILDNGTRGTDICARYGGEEFVILLPDTSPRACLKLAEKLRKAIESAELIYEGITLKITTSFGIATGKKHDELGTALVKKADQALYRAKQTGRNRVCG